MEEQEDCKQSLSETKQNLHFCFNFWLCTRYEENSIETKILMFKNLKV